MTDGTSHQPVPVHSTENHAVDSVSENVQLAYPQLLLEASLQSLLTHSQSSNASTVLNMSSPSGPLSDSWASISDIDYTQEDDLQSENTDTGSLIDASSVQDIHSVNDSGDVSESEQSEEYEGTHLKESLRDFARHKNIPEDYDFIRRARLYSPTKTNQVDVMPLEVAQVEDPGSEFPPRADTTEIVSDHTNLRYNAGLLPSYCHVSESRSHLDLGNRPLRILYLGTTSAASDQKASVLQKVGAALISHDSHGGESSSYHIIPSEFGPGSKPDSSELIPVTKQLTVYECNVPCLRTPTDLGVDLRIVDGSLVICSTEGVFIKKQDEHRERPDLILSIVGENDAEIERESVTKTIMYLQQFHTPILSVEAGGSRILPQLPHDLPSASNAKLQQDDPSILSINIQQFLDIDPDELNQILACLIQPKSNHNTPSLIETCLGKVRNTGSICLQSMISIWRKRDNLVEPQQDDQILRSDGNASTKPTLLNRIWRSAPCCHGATLSLFAIWFIGFPVMLSALRYMVFDTAAITGTWSPPASHQSSVSVSVVAKSTTATETTKPIPTTASRNTDMSLLSGVLQDVAEYWPSHKSSQEAMNQHRNNVGRQVHECGVPATFLQVRRGGLISLPGDFYQDNKADFTISISNGKRAIPFKADDMKRGRRSIKVDGRQLHGLFKILLSSNQKTGPKICAHVNLDGTSMEKFAKMVEKRRYKAGNIDRAHTEWTLVRISKANAKYRSVLEDASRFVLQQIETAHAVVEDQVLAQAIACYQRTDDCWLHKAQQYERDLTAAAIKASGTAKLLVKDAATRSYGAISAIEQASHNVADKMAEMKDSQRKLMTKLARKAGKAQRRARKLMKKGL